MKILDVWFSKPVLFKSDTGRWCCQSVRADEWRVTGNGLTPLDAYGHMKRLIESVYRRAAERVEFVNEADRTGP